MNGSQNNVSAVPPGDYFTEEQYHNVLNKNARIKFICDFILVCIPAILSCTLLTDHLVAFIVTLLGTAIGIVVFSEKAASYLKPEEKCASTWNGFLKLELPARNPAITNFRSFTNICATIGILAVDFNVFPRRFCKTETFGTSVLDVGVGVFMFINAIVAPEARGKLKHLNSIHAKLTSLTQVLVSCIPFIVLGVARVWAVKSIQYQEHISEYGVHWNFFFTLALVRLSSAVVFTWVPVRLCAVIGVIITVCYQYALSFQGLQEFVLHGYDMTDQRRDFLEANREGICSCFGYLAIYLCAVEIGKYIARPRGMRAWLVMLLQLSVIDLCLWVVLYLNHIYVSPISRRMANSAFIIWMLAHNLLAFLLFACADISKRALHHYNILSVRKQENEFCLMEAINRNALVFFLLGNLFTGMVNMSLETIHAVPAVAYAVLISYFFFLCLITCLLHVKGITLKFW